MYLGGKKTIISDYLFIVKNIRMDCHMDASECEGFFYKTLSDNPFKNQIINIRISSDYLTNWTIVGDLYHYSRLKIADTMTCLSYHQNKSPKILEGYSFILSLDGILLNNKQTPIFHDKMTHLAKTSVTLK